MDSFTCLLVIFLLPKYLIYGKNIVEAEEILSKHHGIKIESNEIQIPMFITPVLLIPLISEESIINIKRKLKKILNIEDNLSLEGTQLRNDTEAIFRQSLDRGNKGIIKRSELTEHNETISNVTSIEIASNNNSSQNKSRTNVNDLETNKTQSEQSEGTTQRLPTTMDSGIINYSTPVYDNKNVESSMLSVVTTDESQLPPKLDDKWRYFNTNNTITSNLPSIGVKVNGPYASALYNNAMIDQVSITTNSYTNGKSSTLSQVDGWGTISSLVLPKPNGFKPLAGLYYDGFLDKPPVKMPGFVPYNYD